MIRIWQLWLSVVCVGLLLVSAAVVTTLVSTNTISHEITGQSTIICASGSVCERVQSMDVRLPSSRPIDIQTSLELPQRDVLRQRRSPTLTDLQHL